MAACYEEMASLTINGGTPSTGRVELAATARSYMDAFPDLNVSVDHVLVAGDAVFWAWTITGANNGPGGTGHRVRVSGIEVWTIGSSGLVSNSIGYHNAERLSRKFSQRDSLDAFREAMQEKPAVGCPDKPFCNFRVSFIVDLKSTVCHQP